MSDHQETVTKKDERKKEKERKKQEKKEKDGILKKEKSDLKGVKGVLKTAWSDYAAELKNKEFSTYEDIKPVKQDIIRTTYRLTSQLNQITNTLVRKDEESEIHADTHDGVQTNRRTGHTQIGSNSKPKATHSGKQAPSNPGISEKRPNPLDRPYNEAQGKPGQLSRGWMQDSAEMKIAVTPEQYDQRSRGWGPGGSLENKENDHKDESKNFSKESGQNATEPQPDYLDEDTESTSKALSEEYAKALSSIKEINTENERLKKGLMNEKSHVDKLKKELKPWQEVKLEDATKDSEGNGMQKDSNEKEAEENYRDNHSNKYKDNSQNGPNHEGYADERRRLQHKQGANNNETQQYIDKLKEYQHEMNRLKEDLEKSKQDSDWRIRDLEAKLQNEEQGKSTLQAQVKKITFEKNEALTRLSEIAGRRLLENNPSIADLSTEIRPTKIGENFKQLYDNEWTEAFEELTEQGKTEEECIKALLRIVQDTFTFAMEEAKSFESKLISIVISFPGNANSSNTNTTKDEEELIKQLKRVSAARTSTAVQDVYVRKIKIKENIGERLKLYARKCMELCWYMAVQSPPMVIVSAVQCKGPFDEKYYSRYTATGDLIDYVVWPCTLLHENGPVLAKGVAQATKGNSEAFKRKQAPAAPKQNSDERWSSTKQGAVGQEGISNPNTKYQKKDEKNKNEQNVYNKTEGGRSWQSDGSSKEKTQMSSKSVYMKSGTMDESSARGVTRSHSVKNETITDNKGKYVSTIRL